MLGTAEANSESFLRPYEGGLILEEVQIVPDLFRVLKILADKARMFDVDFILGHPNGSLSSIAGKARDTLTEKDFHFL